MFLYSPSLARTTSVRSCAALYGGDCNVSPNPGPPLKHQPQKGVDVSALSKAEIHERLKKMPGWSNPGKAIQKKFMFGSFVLAMGFVNKVAEAAEAAQHHPDITINYSVVTISLSTHSEGGVTGRDFDLAQQTDEIAAASA